MYKVYMVYMVDDFVVFSVRTNQEGNLLHSTCEKRGCACYKHYYKVNLMGFQAVQAVQAVKSLESRRERALFWW